jgi:ribosomal protein S18 acetylase RimI-like enzyme
VVSLARRKDHVGAVLASTGVPTPLTAVTDSVSVPPGWCTFPCIVKPSGADGAVGITQGSIAEDAAALARALDAAREHSPLLVQELLPGREPNVGIVGDIVLPVAEIEFVDVPAGHWPIVCYAAKWEPGSLADRTTVPRCPAAITADVEVAARTLALAAWQAVGGCGAGRVDLRADAAGRLHVLEINPNPDLAPSAGLARMAAAQGWNYRDLVARLLDDALMRAARADVIAHRVWTGPRTPLDVRPLPASARDAVEQILDDTGMFRDDEIVVALEVIDSYLANPDRDYTALGAFTQGGELIGYSCHGPTPCTLGTWDLYWIAVAPAAQRAGAGSALLQEVERRLAELDARMLLIETSSLPRYEPTRGFYTRHGYHEVARVPEFYGPGDDRVIFAKRILPAHRG